MFHVNMCFREPLVPWLTGKQNVVGASSHYSLPAVHISPTKSQPHLISGNLAYSPQ